MDQAPETLDSLGAKLTAFGRSVDLQFAEIDRRFERVDQRFERVDQRFEQIDQRFEQIDHRFEQIDRRFEQVDQQFDELKAQLRVEIEAVGSNVRLVIERLDDLLKQDATSRATHARTDKRLDNHELRITALERGDVPKK